MEDNPYILRILSYAREIARRLGVTPEEALIRAFNTLYNFEEHLRHKDWQRGLTRHLLNGDVKAARSMAVLADRVYIDIVAPILKDIGINGSPPQITDLKIDMARMELRIEVSLPHSLLARSLTYTETVKGRSVTMKYRFKNIGIIERILFRRLGRSFPRLSRILRKEFRAWGAGCILMASEDGDSIVLEVILINYDWVDIYRLDKIITEAIIYSTHPIPKDSSSHNHNR